MFGPLAGLRAVPRLAMPVTYVAGRGDGVFPAEARALFRTTASSHKRLVILADFAHCTDLLQGPEGDRLRRIVFGAARRASL